MAIKTQIEAPPGMIGIGLLLGNVEDDEVSWEVARGGNVEEGGVRGEFGSEASDEYSSFVHQSFGLSRSNFGVE